MTQLARRVDPYTKAGAEITSATIGTVDGDRFSAQRLLDIYNEARLTLFGVLRSRMTTEELSREISGTYQTLSTLSFSLASEGVRAAVPATYLRAIFLTDGSNQPIIIIPAPLMQVVRQGNNPHFVESPSNRFVVESGGYFIHYGGFVPEGNNYKLHYFGLPTYVLSDVTGGTTNEAFNSDYHHILLELATAIANEQGRTQVLALANTLIGKES